MTLERNLAFLSQAYEYTELPKEKAWLYKYFRKPIQATFLQYYHLFGEYTSFMDHTGYRCQIRWCELLCKKMVFLERMHAEAKDRKDIAMIAFIEKGKFKFSGDTFKKFCESSDEDRYG